MSKIRHSTEQDVIVRRGRVDSVILYEVKENELDILEHGEPTSIHLNFAIFLLSISASSIFALATATFASALVQNLFLFISIIGVLLGLYLVLLWFRGRESINSVIRTIRSRVEPEVVAVLSDEVRVVNEATEEITIENRPDEK